MAYTTGNIASATPWADLATVFQGLVGGAGVANWSYVERIPAGTGAGQSGSASFAVDVYKCAGSGTDANDAGVDWYLAWEIPVTDGAVSASFGVFEDYDGTAKQFRRPAAAASVSAPVGSGYWRSDTLASYTAVTGKAAVQASALNISGFSYWFKLTNNGFIFSTRVGITDSNIIAQLLDTLVDPDFVVDACPLLLTNGAAGQVHVTREPGITNATLSKWAYGINPSNPSFWTWTEQIGSNTANDFDVFLNSKISTSRILVRRNTGGISTYNTIGDRRGLFKSDIITINSGGNVATGDTMDVDGVTHVVIAKNFAANGGFGTGFLTPNT